MGSLSSKESAKKLKKIKKDIKSKGQLPETLKLILHGG